MIGDNMQPIQCAHVMRTSAVQLDRPSLAQITTPQIMIEYAQYS